MRHAILSGIAFLFGAGANAETLLDQTSTIVAPAAPSAVLREFEVTTVGTYEITLTDFAIPQSLTGVRAALLRDGVIIKQIELASPALVSQASFQAAAGTYVLTIVGTPGAAGLGTVGARVRREGDAPVLELTDTIALPNLPPPPTQRILDATIPVAEAGIYRLTVSDVGFPNALAKLRVNLVPEGGAPVPTFDGSGSATFTATPGNYRLFVIADADAAAGAGVFHVDVRQEASISPIYRNTLTVGAAVSLGGVVLTAGAHTLTSSDLALPAPLNAFKLAAVSDGVLAARLDAPGQMDFNASAAAYDLFTVASPAAGSSGSYGAGVRRAGTSVFNILKTASDGASAGAVAFSGVVPTAGNYRLRLTDFVFPQALSGLRAVVTQNGETVLTLLAPGSEDVTLQAGKVDLLVFGLANTSGNGIYGLELRPASGTGATVIEGTSGIGAAFNSWQFSVTTAGRYQIFADDLEFPAQFAGLDAVVTRGPDVIGSFFGGGSFIFNATPGNYFINFIAKPGVLGGGAGTYRMRVATAPNQPTVTFNADSSTVNSGAAANLAWAATDATQCTASGAWSGTKAASGNESTAALSTTSTFNLECQGPGGATSAQVTISVRAPNAPSGGGGSGGGGRVSETLLMMLFAAAAVKAFSARAPAARRR